MANQFTIQALIHKDILDVWHTYHLPEHIKNWNNATSDWHTPHAKSDFQVGGRFNYRMEAKDGSSGFDFTGIFDVIEEPNVIKYHLDDQRVVLILFEKKENNTFVQVTIDAEDENSIALQKRGWQAILDNFKAYVEKLK